MALLSSLSLSPTSQFWSIQTLIHSQRSAPRMNQRVNTGQGCLVSVTLELSNHRHTAGVTLEQQLSQGMSCDGTGVSAHPSAQGEATGLRSGVKPGQGGPKSPHHGITTALLTPAHPHCCLCPTAPAPAMGQSQLGGVTLSHWDTLGRDRGI